ncbi:hypothetical protein O181_040743 [Austropuccinia psidii MF-1]|uniref:Uncharacterized protein n=1 Tax=Austropuccinia psidii MF-1 TaxID=1389203 RepID=A0A9Q3DHU0_9BASI|nr:hypothetical protein [Austropuccinia psidii MF-1]
MPSQNSPPARKTRFLARTQAVLTPTPRVPPDGTPEVPKMRAYLNKGQSMEGEETSRKEVRAPRRSRSFFRAVGAFDGISETSFKGLGEDGEEEKENFVEEEGSDRTEVVPASVGASKGT